MGGLFLRGSSNRYDSRPTGCGAGMRRREFLGVLGGAAAWPLPGHAQQGRVRPLIGWLGGSTRQAASRNHDAFIQGLRQYGYEDGKTIDMVYRWAEGSLSQ